MQSSGLGAPQSLERLLRKAIETQGFSPCESIVQQNETMNQVRSTQDNCKADDSAGSIEVGGAEVAKHIYSKGDGVVKIAEPSDLPSPPAPDSPIMREEHVSVKASPRRHLAPRPSPTSRRDSIQASVPKITMQWPDAQFKQLKAIKVKQADLKIGSVEQ